MIKILNNKAKRRRIRRRVQKQVCDLGILLKAEIYSRTAGKYGQTPMEILKGNTIDISEYTEFYFYYLCWYWDNHTDNK